METFTVAQFGRSTSRVTTAAERGPVAITRQDKQVAVVVSPSEWSFAEEAMAWYRRLRDDQAEEISGSTEERPDSEPDPGGGVHSVGWTTQEKLDAILEPSGPKPRCDACPGCEQCPATCDCHEIQGHGDAVIVCPYCGATRP